MSSAAVEISTLSIKTLADEILKQWFQRFP